MVLIFGAGPGKPEDLGEVAPTTCPNCHNEVFLHLVRSTKRVSLYFVPVMPYGTNEYLVCPVCRTGLELSKAHGATVRQMQAMTQQYRRGQVDPNAYRSQAERFWAGLGIAPAGSQPPRGATAVPAPARPSTAPPGSSEADRLAQLGRLHADGVLTDEEFTAAKARVIAGPAPNER